MPTLTIGFPANDEAALADARVLRDQLEQLDGVQSAELPEAKWPAEPGSKTGLETITQAAVILALLPAVAQVAGQGVIDWLRAYLSRPNQPNAVRLTVTLDSGAQVEAAFNPRDISEDELARMACSLKSVLED